MTKEILKLVKVRADWRADNLRLVDEHQQQVNRAVAAEARVRQLTECLEFYSDPWKHKAEDDSVPDFYDEMDFGARARLAIAASNQIGTAEDRSRLSATARDASLAHDPFER